MWLPAETQRAICKAIASGLKPLRARSIQPLSQWAEKHFKLDEESSHVRGGWRAWPFQIGWMDAFSNDDIVEVDVEKAKRVGYTKTIVAFAAYNAARRRKQAIWQPTDDDRDSFVKSEIAPAFDLCRALNSVRRSGIDNDTLKFKRFRGSVAHFLGAKAARNFRRITVAVSVLDEIDAMPQVVEKTIDPFTGAKGRLEGAPFPKIVIGTTPRVKQFSHIRRRSTAADARLRYQITCPHCEADHPLTWGGPEVRHGFKWDGREPDAAAASVRHHCPHCSGAISQAQYMAIWHQGSWADPATGYRYDHIAKVWYGPDDRPCVAPRHVAFVGIWTAYSPQREWGDIVREFLQARATQKQGDSGPMQGFVNETLADVWEEEFEHTEASVLIARAATEAPLNLRTVPLGACKILMGIDTQADRWEAVTWAIGRGEEMWPIDYRVVYGNPADDEDWAAKLDPLLSTQYRHVNGLDLPIDATGIDTGGHWTHQAYNYVRSRPHMRVYATKGDPALGQPIKMRPTWVDVNARGRTQKRGVKLWKICVDTAKDLLHSRLDKVKAAGPGCVHLNRELPLEWYEQLTAEHRIRVRTAHGWAQRWTCPSGHRNEVLDCTVIVLLLVQILGLHTTTTATWDTWEKSLLTRDLFAPADPPAALPPPEPPPLAARPVAPRPSPVGAHRVAPRARHTVHADDPYL